MRLVAKHAQVGYLTPSERPGCRNCKFYEQGFRESPIAATPSTYCRKHSIECTSGAICQDHTLSRQPGQDELEFQLRQMDIFKHRFREFVVEQHASYSPRQGATQ